MVIFGAAKLVLYVIEKVVFFSEVLEVYCPWKFSIIVIIKSLLHQGF